MPNLVFTSRQVKNLNAYQHEPTIHPFTCSEHSEEPLFATVRGWICPYCDYTQDWAHEFMLNYHV